GRVFEAHGSGSRASATNRGPRRLGPPYLLNRAVCSVAKPPPQQIAKDTLAALRGTADGKLAATAQTFFKEPVTLRGVRAADMRRIARETYLRVKPHWSLADAVALCEIMLRDPRLEMKGVAVLVCERFGDEFDASLLAVIQKWIERGDCASWAIID